MSQEIKIDESFDKELIHVLDNEDEMINIIENEIDNQESTIEEPKNEKYVASSMLRKQSIKMLNKLVNNI